MTERTVFAMKDARLLGDSAAPKIPFREGNGLRCMSDLGEVVECVSGMMRRLEMRLLR